MEYLLAVVVRRGSISLHGPHLILCEVFFGSVEKCNVVMHVRKGKNIRGNVVHVTF